MDRGTWQAIVRFKELDTTEQLALFQKRKKKNHTLSRKLYAEGLQKPVF